MPRSHVEINYSHALGYSHYINYFTPQTHMNRGYITGYINVKNQTIPRVTSEIKTADFGGAVMVRWGFGRDRYMVAPGLYAIGAPGSTSDVFVTSNYKLSFDHLRKNLKEDDAWILVLDTNGINVWCAAGKGTFGTQELISRIRLVELETIVNHRRLILPQLGATGVASYKVKEETGFNVLFGPVRASDIKRFIKEGYKADKEMRKVKFDFIDRLKLIPNDFLYGKFYLSGAVVIVLILSLLNSDGISLSHISDQGSKAALIASLAYLSGIVLTPMFLPYIPGRYFSLKGLFTGSLIFMIYLLFFSTSHNLAVIISWLFIVMAISSFTAMNFTGSSTYTSLSGVRKEMKIFIPVQISLGVAGILLQLAGKLIK